MKYFCAYDPNTFIVKDRYGGSCIEAGRSVDLIHVEVPPPFDFRSVMVKPDGTLGSDPNLVEIFRNFDLKQIRVQRNKMLTLCDFVQNQDYPMDPQLRSEWYAFRQALRDLPNDVTDPQNPVWPTPPSKPQIDFFPKPKNMPIPPTTP
jgi:Phage tail assembly chaperone protein